MKLFKNWIEDSNNVAPHSGLGLKSPVEYRKLMNQAVSLKGGSRAGKLKYDRYMIKLLSFSERPSIFEWSGSLPDFPTERDD